MAVREDIYYVLNWNEECINTSDGEEFLNIAYQYIYNYLDLQNKQKYNKLSLVKQNKKITLTIFDYQLIIVNTLYEIIFSYKNLSSEEVILAKYGLISKEHMINEKKILNFHPSYFINLLEKAFNDFSKVASKIKNEEFYV